MRSSMGNRQVTESTLGETVDVTAPKIVQIQIRNDGKVVWINVDGLCVLRCCQIGEIHIEDERIKRKGRAIHG